MGAVALISMNEIIGYSKLKNIHVLVILVDDVFLENLSCTFDG